MQTFVVSNYNNDLSWLPEYTDNYIIYDQHEASVYPEGIDQSKVLKRPHKGTDIYDKFSWIIDNYDNLPEIAVLIKGNLFKYISKEEWDTVAGNKTFTPLLTQHHKVYGDVCHYEDGMYCEKNDRWYMNHYPSGKGKEVYLFLGLEDYPYLKFAPGSNYIVPREHILKHSKAFYEQLLKYLDVEGYPGEGQVIERSLYYIWK